MCSRNRLGMYSKGFLCTYFISPFSISYCCKLVLHLYNSRCFPLGDNSLSLLCASGLRHLIVPIANMLPDSFLDLFIFLCWIFPFVAVTLQGSYYISNSESIPCPKVFVIGLSKTGHRLPGRFSRASIIPPYRLGRYPQPLLVPCLR